MLKGPAKPGLFHNNRHPTRNKPCDVNFPLCFSVFTYALCSAIQWIVLATPLPLLVVWYLDIKARERKILQTGIGKTQKIIET